MRHAVSLVLLAILLTGCLGGGNKPPTTPDELFTGEPTPVTIALERQGVVQPMARLMSAESDDSSDMLSASIRVQRRTPSGYVDFERVFIIDVPRDATTVELPIELSATKNYHITASVYDPNRLSSDRLPTMVELSYEQSFGVMAQHVNRVAIPVQELQYEIVAPDELYSGGDLRQIHIRLPNGYYLRDMRISSYYGLNPWDRNGAFAFWGANAGHAATGKPDTGWLDTGSAPQVDEPTTLYYAFSICMPLYLKTQSTWMCAYVPDLDAGEKLFEITIYPEPNDL